MYEIPGYSPVLIPIVLTIGFLLSPLKPYMGFLFAVLLLTAADTAMFNQTRTTLLGPYLNLADVCIVIALVSLFFDKYRAKELFRLPPIVALLVAVLILSAMQSFWKFGWTYETLRSFRWALDVPIAFFIGANIATSPKRVRGLIAALFCGAVLATVQHMVFVVMTWRTKGLTMELYGLMRTISFWAGCMPSAFLVTAVVWKLPAEPLRKGMYLIACLLFLGTVFLNQTRSLWLATVATALFVIFLFRKGKWSKTVVRVVFGGAIMLVGLVGLGQRLMPGLDIVGIMCDRMATFSKTNAVERGTATRENAFHAEFNAWMEGTLVFGRGLCYFQTVENPKDDIRHIAFGHLGYVTYLSQTGLLGLFAYGLLLPLGVIRNGWWLWFHGRLPELRFVGLLSIASILVLSIMFMASAHFLALGYFAPAVLYGTGWAMVRSCRRAQWVHDDDIVEVLE